MRLKYRGSWSMQHKRYEPVDREFVIQFITEALMHSNAKPWRDRRTEGVVVWRIDRSVSIEGIIVTFVDAKNVPVGTIQGTVDLDHYFNPASWVEV